MPITKKNNPGRGIPRKAGSPSKAKYLRYLAKSSCYRCKLVFRTPRYKHSHDRSDHTLTTGANRRRSVSPTSSF